jgi:hypothetical protein
MYPKVNSLLAAWFVAGNQRTIVKMRRERGQGNEVSFFMGAICPEPLNGGTTVPHIETIDGVSMDFGPGGEG